MSLLDRIDGQVWAWKLFAPDISRAVTLLEIPNFSILDASLPVYPQSSIIRITAFIRLL